MDVYILNEENQPDQLIDYYESFIWTERYNALGDFEMYLASDRVSRTLIKTGQRIIINESDRVMEIESIEDSWDDEGRAMLLVKGRSMELILDDRIARPDTSNLTTKPKWLLSGTPATIARTIFFDVCRLAKINAADLLDDVLPVTPSTTGRIPEPSDTIKVELEPTTVRLGIEDICKGYDLGYRIIRTSDYRYQFSIYTGKNRTTAQTVNAPVVFSPGLDNLQNAKGLELVKDAKNVAYVIGPTRIDAVYAEGVDPTVTEFERRVLLVKIDSLEEGMTAAQIEAYQIQRGKEELAKHRKVRAFDGEISQSSQYKYRVDYELGDLVEIQNTDGAVSRMLVTENIFVSDVQGERSYPTLVLYEYVQPGTWNSYQQLKQWEALTIEEWDDLP